MRPVAIIAGAGVLPQLLANECRRIGRAYVVVQFQGIKLDWAKDHPTEPAEIETLDRLFARLHSIGCLAAVFAGAMARPHVDVTRLDGTSAGLLASINTGDDTTLRAAAALFESRGMVVEAAQDILPDLLVGAGALGQIIPTADDLEDMARAAEIVVALGRADVGQAAVVAQGICLGLESIQGTDALLRFVKETGAGFRPDPLGANGVLFKAPKPQQDRRFDLPAIGPETAKAAAKAGLAGIGLAAGQVLVLDRAATIATAQQLGLFIYGHTAKA